jgi:hypothetical protein
MSHNNRTRPAHEENGAIDPMRNSGLHLITRTARAEFACASDPALDLRYEGPGQCGGGNTCAQHAKRLTARPFGPTRIGIHVHGSMSQFR